ncbi:hypothetical protein NECAME_08322 [Necator americanus]|uniref:Uncharacterized protein n=1 Tax=Necator americanus TaxID=51031 RepID=W2TKY7_NECAM|nr:hypothetical protein NECAME_08322 [Necator americanus]ETN81697.1 hypothetical protein NECAME_08322 [Necator americanus]
MPHATCCEVVNLKSQPGQRLARYELVVAIVVGPLLIFALRLQQATIAPGSRQSATVCTRQ